MSCGILNICASKYIVTVAQNAIKVKWTYVSTGPLRSKCHDWISHAKDVLGQGL